MLHFTLVCVCVHVKDHSPLVYVRANIKDMCERNKDGEGGREGGVDEAIEGNI
jgi:hypothetical protein